MSDKYIHCFAWIDQRDTSQACLLGQNRLEFGHFRMRSHAQSYKKCRAHLHAKWGLAHPTRTTAHSALTSFLPRAPTRPCGRGEHKHSLSAHSGSSSSDRKSIIKLLQSVGSAFSSIFLNFDGFKLFRYVIAKMLIRQANDTTHYKL